MSLLIFVHLPSHGDTSNHRHQHYYLIPWQMLLYKVREKKAINITTYYLHFLEIVLRQTWDPGQL